MINRSLIDVKVVIKQVRRSEFALGLFKQVNFFSKQVEQSVVFDPAEEQLVCDFKVLALLKNIVVKYDHIINVLLRIVPEKAKELVIMYVAFVPAIMPVRATIDVHIAKVSLVVVVEL